MRMYCTLKSGHKKKIKNAGNSKEVDKGSWIELTRETLIHSGQGCRYTSIGFIQLVNDKEERQLLGQRIGHNAE